MLMCNYSDAIMITTNSVTLFTDSTPKGLKMKNVTSKVKIKNIHVKLLLSAESKQVNLP